MVGILELISNYKNPILSVHYVHF